MEFMKVLDKANDAFPKLDQFFRQSIHSTSIDICKIHDTYYDEEMKQFVPLSSLDKEDKQIIANAVLINLKVFFKEFNNLEIPLYKKIVGQIKRPEKSKHFGFIVKGKEFFIYSFTHD
jgi:hypothetical protein